MGIVLAVHVVSPHCRRGGRLSRRADHRAIRRAKKGAIRWFWALLEMLARFMA
jgi:hypothetical protein